MYQETADIETASDDYASRFSGQTGQYFLETQSNIVTNLLTDVESGASVLEVGGGHGQLLQGLLDKKFSVTITGSDDSCRKRLDTNFNPSDFSYKTCDTLHLPFDDKSFDVVICIRLLPHAVQWQTVLAEMCRVSRTCVIFDYPDIRSSNILYSLLFRLKKEMEGNTRTYTLFKRQQMRDALAENTFISPRFIPEFFLPMVLHRKLANSAFSRITENLFRICGATHLLGSPIIVRSNRESSDGQ